MQRHRPLSSLSRKKMNYPMRLSLLVGFFLLVVKSAAFYLTNSAAILSDAAEAVIHLFAVGFATYSMWLSLKPADQNHPYGHEKITYFSAGFEGAMIIFAALYILYEAVHRISFTHEVENLGYGFLLIGFSVVINLFLGFYLIRKGKSFRSLVLESNGKHILTDCWTSINALVALVLVKTTGIYYFDPIIAMITAFGILWTGYDLIKKSVKGLMDETNMPLHYLISGLLEKETKERDLHYHFLRERTSGQTTFIEFHLLFPDEMPIKKAHQLATEIEVKLKDSLDTPCEILTHLEPEKDHDHIHQKFGLPG